MTVHKTRLEALKAAHANTQRASDEVRRALSSAAVDAVNDGISIKNVAAWSGMYKPTLRGYVDDVNRRTARLN